ncbi:uncharacterized protein LOC126558490 [Anopheles maculipalpis]|uniref:uncharacterized protein LOC126558490 n=1 Tax=Anopheles maculipalpis TaxID=1496333 RepID=UPI002158B0DD|nr:uncharacterized protein LOC126558490 [Anopheles maculipalpis]
MSIVDGIRYWALSTNAPHSSINIILKLFKKANVKVPLTAKTLLRTNRNPSTEIKQIGGGQFWYRGFEKCLLNYFRFNKITIKNLSLTVSIDGLPLHNSSNMQFWPILFTVYELSESPVMTAAIFCGQNKPESVEEYLRPMVEELKFLTTKGITINGEFLTVKIRCFVADTPARAFIKGVTGHTGYAGCLKCTVIGTYHNEAHTMAFTGLNAPKRTDQGFRDDAYPGHRKTSTPITDLLGIDIIEDTITADRLHLIDLGIMKRLIIGWRDGSLGRKRWSPRQLTQISEQLEKIQLPTEIHRKLRSIKYLHYWKASECASFLHYASIVILKDRLPTDIYNHFMLLFCAVTLLSSTIYKDKWQFAGQFLDRFVQDFDKVYGERYMSSNVHNLQHMYDEVQRFGSLSSISTYPFENQLQHLKRTLRSGFRNLEQAINRISECDEFHLSKSNSQIKFPTVAVKGNTTTVHVRPGFQLRNNLRDSWFLAKDEKIVKFHETNQCSEHDIDKITIKGYELCVKGLIFNDPIESSEIFIFKGCTNSLSESLMEMSIEQIKCKLVAVHTDRKHEAIFIPLIHTLV